VIGIEYSNLPIDEIPSLSKHPMSALQLPWPRRSPSCAARSSCSTGA
jgi:hypothetical protein